MYLYSGTLHSVVDESRVIFYLSLAHTKSLRMPKETFTMSRRCTARGLHSAPSSRLACRKTECKIVPLPVLIPKQLDSEFNET
jgi:hypothetical protein